MTIIINGSLGVGKSSTSWLLMKKFEKSVMIDADYFAAFHPSSIFDKASGEYTYKTIAHLISFHKENGYPNFIINYVFENKDSLNSIIQKLELIGEEVFTVRLVCDEKENRERILKRNNDSKDWELKRYLQLNKIQEQASKEGFIGKKINTSQKNLEEIVSEILDYVHKINL